MTLVVSVDGVALPDGALTITGAPNSSLPGGVQGLPLGAYYGEALTGNYSIDDPNGEYDFTGLHTIIAEETSATNPFITGGWITGRTVGRGIYKSGVSRVWSVDFIDINWNFALMVFRASSAKRPYETDLARIQFIRESAPMAYTPSYDNGRFNVTDNPINFDESDLVGKFPIEAINEFVGIAGKNFYNYWDPDEEQISIHYDLIGVGPTAALTISNDIADTSSTCFYPFIDAELSMGPAYKVTGMLLKARGFNAYGIRQATIDELGPSIFSPDGLQRDEVYSTERVGRLETANNLIQSMLAQRAIDTDTITVTIRVPAAKVNDALPGDVVTVKFTHLPDYETDTELPIIRRNVVPSPGRTDSYDLHLELSGVGLPTGPGGGDPGPFPYEPAECNPNPNIQSKFATASLGGTVTLTLDDVPTPGNTLVAALTLRNTGTILAPTGFTQIETQQADNDGQVVALFYREVQPGDTAVVTSGPGNPSHALRLLVTEISGVVATPDNSDVYSDDVDHGASTWDLPMGTVTTTPGGIVMGVGIIGNNPADPSNAVPDFGAITLKQGITSGGPGYWFGYRVTDAGDTSYTMTVTWTTPSGIAHGQAAISAFFECSGEGSSVPPGAAVPVRNEFVAMGDGSTVDFTTRWPFADGSLRVRYDNTDQTPQIVSYDGITGDFTMTGAPIAGQQVFVDYIGR